MHSPNDRTWRPQIIAHRGVSAHAPENTAPAFERALRDRADGIELDLQLSKDGQPVVYHDQWLTKLQRRSRRVRNYTLEQLQSLDAGGWFAPAFSGEKLLSAHEVLQRWAPRTPLMLELKAHGRGQRGPWDLALVDALIPVLQRCDAAVLAQLSILSFSAPLLDRFCAVWSDSEGPGLHIVRNLEGPAQLRALTPGQRASYSALCINIDRFGPRESVRLQSLECPLYCYTVDSAAQIENARALGCSRLISNDPAACRRQISRSNSGRSARLHLD